MNFGMGVGVGMMISGVVVLVIGFISSVEQDKQERNEQYRAMQCEHHKGEVRRILPDFQYWEEKYDKYMKNIEAGKPAIGGSIIVQMKTLNSFSLADEKAKVEEYCK